MFFVQVHTQVETKGNVRPFQERQSKKNNSRVSVNNVLLLSIDHWINNWNQRILLRDPILRGYMEDCFHSLHFVSLLLLQYYCCCRLAAINHFLFFFSSPSCSLAPRLKSRTHQAMEAGLSTKPHTNMAPKASCNSHDVAVVVLAAAAALPAVVAVAVVPLLSNCPAVSTPNHVHNSVKVTP
mmetsp:Transcript_4734/g.13226  ORF Transcript_4734/g.13226 Transcript_4734/m.13226 type:complete len:182 (+) Transcript_4734:1592-2137(+)